jgi:hypothetical protein
LQQSLSHVKAEKSGTFVHTEKSAEVVVAADGAVVMPAAGDGIEVTAPVHTLVMALVGSAPPHGSQQTAVTPSLTSVVLEGLGGMNTA